MRTDRESGAREPGRSSHAGEALQCRTAALPRLGPQGRGAFTLVELLVVMAIIAILAGLLMPAIRGALNRAHEASTLSLIHQVQIACTSYFNDHGTYPPSEWNELDEAMRFDLNGDGVYNRAQDEVWDATGARTPAALADPRFAPLSDMPAPGAANATNVGIEVLVACLASRNGGPYMDFSGPMLGDTDNIPDNAGVGIVTNWTFNTNQLFELVDWWGNPLVYVQNTHYADHDGVLADLGGGVADYEDPQNPPVPQEFVPYVGADGNGYPCYARSYIGTQTGNYPNLDNFQLYSWGLDAYPGRSIVRYDAVAFDANPVYPGWTAANGTTAADQLNGTVPSGATFAWQAGDGNLCNWEE